MAFTATVKEVNVDERGFTRVVVAFDLDGTKGQNKEFVFIPGTKKPDAVRQIKDYAVTMFSGGVGLKPGDSVAVT